MNSTAVTTLVYLSASLLTFKYAALFLISYLAALLIPLPSNTSLLAASAFASQGYFNIYIVLLVALAANILGDWTGYWLSDRYGETFLNKVGLRRVIVSRGYKNIETMFHRHHRITIFVTRFFGGVGPLVNIISGLSKEITFRTFVVYGALGEAVYVLSLSAIGYFVGIVWENLLLSIESAGAGIALLIILFILYESYSHRHHD